MVTRVLPSMIKDIRVADVATFGVYETNSAAQNDVAINAAFAWLNTLGGHRTLTMGEGTFQLLNAFPVITRSDVSFMGAGERTRLRLPVDSMSAAFFRVGDGSGDVTARVTVKGFTVQVMSVNPATTGYVADLDHCIDVDVSLITCIGVCGLIRLGNTLSAFRPTCAEWRGSYNTIFNHRLIRGPRCLGTKLIDLKVYGFGTTKQTVPGFDFSALVLCDGLSLDRVEIFAAIGGNTGFLVDATFGAVVNIWITDCVFDKWGGTSAAMLFRILADTTSDATNFRDVGRIQEVWITNTRTDTGVQNAIGGGTAIRIVQEASTGFSRISNFMILGHSATYRDGPSVVSRKNGTDALQGIHFIGGNFGEASNATIESVFDFNHGDFSVVGVINAYGEQPPVTTNTTALVKISADVRNFVVANNIIVTGAVAVTHFAYADAFDTSRQVVGNTDPGGSRIFTNLLGVGEATIRPGVGSPEGVISAAKGSMWLRIDDGASASLYVKETVSGNTGWVSK